MRNSLLSALCLLLAAAPAIAADRKAADSVKHASAAPAEHHYHSEKTWGIGVADTQTVTTGESATALIGMGDDWLQTYLGVYQTKGAFSFAIGGAYKFTVAGTRSTGFHIGPGFTAGTVADDFAFSIFGAAGGHFTFNEHLFFSIDAGPMVTHTKNNTNFVVRGFGPVLGLTIAYIF